MKPNQFKTILISLLIYCLIVQPIFASMPQLKSISETHGKQSAKYKVFITHDDIIIPGINEYAYLDLEFSEWIELVELGANELAGANKDKIISATFRHIGRYIEDTNMLYGGGKAANRIAKRLSKG